MHERKTGIRGMQARVKPINTPQRTAAEFGLIAGLIATAIVVALVAVGQPIIELFAIVFGLTA
jgi:hypothetical protein